MLQVSPTCVTAPAPRRTQPHLPVPRSSKRPPPCWRLLRGTRGADLELHLLFFCVSPRLVPACAEGRPGKGSKVRLSATGRTDGPLTRTNIGTVVEDDGTSVPFLVRVPGGGGEGLYAEDALEIVEEGAGRCQISSNFVRIHQNCARGRRQTCTSRPSGRLLRSAVAHSVAGRIQTAES